MASLARGEDVPSFAKDVPNVTSGAPILQFNGKDLTGFYTYTQGHKLRRPRTRSSPSATAMIRVSGEEYGGFTTAEELQRTIT